MKQLHNRRDRRLLKELIEKSTIPRTTVSFYKYAKIGNPQIFRDHLYSILSTTDVLGRIYVASEGINGQISVPDARFEGFKDALYSITFLIDDDGKSFFKLAIKVRQKIVADGIADENFDVTDNGVHINAQQFNEMTDQDDTVVIDMRNHYEHEVGHFKGAIKPDVETFRESLVLHGRNSV